MVVTPNSPEPDVNADSAIVAALRAGDQDIFRDVVARLNPGLVRLARSYVSAELAEEVAQETWVAVVRNIDAFEERSSLTTWIYRILLNKVRTLAKREAKIVPFAAMGHTSDGNHPAVDPERMLHPTKGPGNWASTPSRWENLPAERLESSEVLDMIIAAIAQLPAGQREVIELRDILGRSADEVCNTLGISSVNQRVLLHRARAAVRAMLEEYLANE
ncbi:MAG: RNA polymerase sigma factor [Acidimicrobiales bacterium]